MSRPELACRVPQHDRSRPEGAEDQSAPDHQSGKKSDLPETAELNIGQALIAEPEPSVLDVAHDAEIVAGESADDDKKRHPEQKIDQKPLTLGLMSADGGRQKQRGADP